MLKKQIFKIDNNGVLIEFLNKTITVITPEMLKDIKNIGIGAFEDCILLKKISIPNNINKLDRGAFQNCYSLESVTVSKNIKFGDNFVFHNCVNLKEFIISETIYNVIKIEDFLFIINSSKKDKNNFTIMSVKDIYIENEEITFPDKHKFIVKHSGVFGIGTTIDEAKSKCIKKINNPSKIFIKQNEK